MKKLLRGLGILVLVLAMGMVVFPARVAKASVDIYVPSSSYPTIQSGIDAASAGDTVHVAAGTYNEQITLTDGVKLLGAGASITTIDGSNNGSVITAINVGSATQIDGFTIINGTGTYDNSYLGYFGGGIYDNNASPTVSNCIFTKNSAIGGGIANRWGSSPTVSNCVFYANSGCGGGMANFWNSSPTVNNCIFYSNSAPNGGTGAMTNFKWCSPTVTNCIFYSNSAPNGAGMYNEESTPTVTNCTFFGNSAEYGGAMRNDSGSIPNLTNCILWGDSSSSYGGGEECDYYGASAVITYCDVQGGRDGTGNINADPLFFNPSANNYHLQTGSPCIDTGSNIAVPSWLTTDIEGNPRILNGVVDMGAYEYSAPLPTTISITSSQNPSTYGQVVTFTAIVTSSSSTPTGTVQFDIDNAAFGTPVTMVNGSATSGATSSLSVSDHTVTAIYSGDTSFNSSIGTLSGGQVVQASGDATLSGLTLSGVTLDKTFASSINSYTATVPNSLASITVTPTVNESDATAQFHFMAAFVRRCLIDFDRCRSRLCGSPCAVKNGSRIAKRCRLIDAIRRAGNSLHVAPEIRSRGVPFDPVSAFAERILCLSKRRAVRVHTCRARHCCAVDAVFLSASTELNSNADQQDGLQATGGTIWSEHIYVGLSLGIFRHDITR